MRWVNKGHELDDYAKLLIQKFRRKHEKIYIFGAGMIGREIALVFERYRCFAGYIDNDMEKQSNDDFFNHYQRNNFTGTGRSGNV